MPEPILRLPIRSGADPLAELALWVNPDQPRWPGVAIQSPHGSVEGWITPTQVRELVSALTVWADGVDPAGGA